MQMNSTTTWWLTFAMVAVQGLTTLAWNTMGVDAHTVAIISQVCGYCQLLLMFAIHGTIPGVSSVSMPVKAAIAFFAIMLVSLILATPASAQLKPLKPLTGDIAKDFSPAAPASPLTATGKNQLIQLWQSLQKASAVDITYAIAMATAANKASAPNGIVTAAGMRLNCLTAIQTLNGQIGGGSLVDANGKPLTRPDPALFTDAETFAEVIDAVQPGGPLWTSCSGAAQLAATDTLAFVNALVSGAAGLALVAPK